jgi:hypothetical protein
LAASGAGGSVQGHKGMMLGELGDVRHERSRGERKVLNDELSRHMDWGRKVEYLVFLVSLSLFFFFLRGKVGLVSTVYCLQYNLAFLENETKSTQKDDMKAHIASSSKM